MNWPDHDPLYKHVLELTEALEQAGSEPMLIGGLAVGLWRRRALASATIPPDITRVLELDRSTRDIDFSVVRSASARNRLATLNYAQRGEFGHRRGDIRVDLLEADIAHSKGPRLDASDVLPALRERFDWLRLDETDRRVRVLRPAGLVILKAVAYENDPARGKDLIDIATLAFLDFRRGETRSELRELVTLAPEPIRRLNGHFRDQDCAGPIATAREFNRLPQYDESWDARDEELRAMSSAAVLRLLDVA